MSKPRLEKGRVGGMKCWRLVWLEPICPYLDALLDYMETPNGKTQA